MDVIWRLRNEKVRKNSKITLITIIKVISSLVPYYVSTMNNVSCNHFLRLRTQDVNYFIVSSNFVLGRNGRSPTAISTSHFMCLIY